MRNLKMVHATAMLFCLLMFFSACSEEKEANKAIKIPKSPESFTFFEVGANTRFTESLRDQLRDKLGNDAIERRNIIDLEINHEGFLQRYFPQLHTLNTRLNSQVGIRVEHHTVKLRYRYMQNKNTPFDYVELLFSGYTQKPLMFRIKSRKEGTEILETLKKRHGTPRIIEWGREKERSFYWEKNRDILLLSFVLNQFERPEYEITMYYVNSLETLLQHEKQAKEREQREKENALKDAF